MATYQSPIRSSSGDSSFSKCTNCFCGRRARIFTSWSLKNPGRRFYTCATRKDDNGCNFFEWFEEDFCPRALDVITQLNQRRIFLEEKLRIMEENLAQVVEKKKAIKAERNRIKKQMKVFLFVVVMLTALMLVYK